MLNVLMSYTIVQTNNLKPDLLSYFYKFVKKVSFLELDNICLLALLHADYNFFLILSEKNLNTIK